MDDYARAAFFGCPGTGSAYNPRETSTAQTGNPIKETPISPAPTEEPPTSNLVF